MRVPGLDELRFRGRQELAKRLELLGLGVPKSGLSESFPDAPWRDLSCAPPGVRGSMGDVRSRVRNALRFAPNLVDRWKHATEGARSGQLDLLGLGPVQYGSPPDWHLDARSGKRAPLKHWSRIPTLNAFLVGDHKVIWEPNRHQYLLPAAMMWILSEDPAYPKLVARHVSSWLVANPPRRGINWASSLEVSYRAISWCWLLWLMRDFSWDRSLLRDWMLSLEYHALHVERYLSTYFSPNTHLTGEALGLMYVSSALPASSHANRFREKGVSIIQEWMDKQIYNDGVYAEQATQYQRYTAEILLHYNVLRESAGLPRCEKARSHLGRLVQVLKTIASSESIMPLIGDDDGGLLCPLDWGVPDQIESLLTAGAGFLGDLRLLPARGRDVSLGMWLTEHEQLEWMATSAPAEPPGSQHYTDGGLVVIREDYELGSEVAVIDAGRHGFLNGGHAHADSLAMTLQLGRSPLFVDRGTLTYVDADRNEYRSTCSHNTAEFDGESSVLPLGPFHWARKPPAPSAFLRKYGRMTVFEGVSEGHLHTKRISAHFRSVCRHEAGAWVVIDEGIRPSLSELTIRWHLAPGLKLENQGDGRFLATTTDDAKAVAAVIMLNVTSATCERTRVSRRYGASREAALIRAATSGTGPVVTVIIPQRAMPGNAAAGTIVANLDRAGEVTWEDPAGCNAIVVTDSEVCWSVGAAPGVDKVDMKIVLQGWRGMAGAGEGSGESVTNVARRWAGEQRVLVLGASGEGWRKLPGTTIGYVTERG